MPKVANWKPAQAVSTRPTSDDFRDVIGRFASGVTVITTRHEGRNYGSTASAVSSLSAEPPMLLICLNKASASAHAVAASGTFAVNVLAEDHVQLAGRFASKLADKFEGVPTEADVNGSTFAGRSPCPSRMPRQRTGGSGDTLRFPRPCRRGCGLPWPSAGILPRWFWADADGAGGFSSAGCPRADHRRRKPCQRSSRSPRTGGRSRPGREPGPPCSDCPRQ